MCISHLPTEIRQKIFEEVLKESDELASIEALSTVCKTFLNDIKDIFSFNSKKREGYTNEVYERSVVSSISPDRVIIIGSNNSGSFLPCTKINVAMKILKEEKIFSRFVPFFQWNKTKNTEGEKYSWKYKQMDCITLNEKTCSKTLEDFGFVPGYRYTRKMLTFSDSDYE